MKIRRIKESDIKRVASLHMECLPNTVSSKLGQFYLEKIYKVFAKYKNNSAFVIVNKNIIIGSVGLTSDLNKFQMQIKQELTLKDYFLITKSITMFRVTFIELIQRILFEHELIKKYTIPYKSIVTLFIEKHYRRQKIATKLLKFIIKNNKNLNARFYVDTLVNNNTAIKFYKKFGFFPIAKIKDSILFLLIKQNKI